MMGGEESGWSGRRTKAPFKYIFRIESAEGASSSFFVTPRNERFGGRGGDKRQMRARVAEAANGCAVPSMSVVLSVEKRVRS